MSHPHHLEGSHRIIVDTTGDLRVLTAAEPGAIATGPRAGQPSRIAYRIDPAVVEEARSRVTALLSSYPVYPELDLDALREVVAGVPAS